MTLLVGAILGAISGMIWSTVLGGEWEKGIWVGALVGAIIGLFFVTVNYAISSGGRMNTRETGFVSGSILLLLFLVSVVLSIIIGVLRLIF